MTCDNVSRSGVAGGSSAGSGVCNEGFTIGVCTKGFTIGRRRVTDLGAEGMADDAEEVDDGVEELARIFNIAA